MATTPLLLILYLLNNLEADTQRMRMLIPIGTKQYELANLGGRTDMLADTWTNIIITDTNQTQGLARIIRIIKEKSSNGYYSIAAYFIFTEQS